MIHPDCENCPWFDRPEGAAADELPRCLFPVNDPGDCDIPECLEKSGFSLQVIHDLFRRRSVRNILLVFKILMTLFGLLCGLIIELWLLRFHGLAFLASLLVFFLAWIFVPVRLVLLHPVKTVFFGVKDLYFFFAHKEYNNLEAGKLDAYVAEFGGGKTLSIVHEVYRLYEKYNNVMVWDRGRKKFVTQKIHIVSNVEFTGIPFEELHSLSQVVNMTNVNREIDEKNDTRTVVLVVLDEASVQLNSRSFKDNIDPLFLNTLLTCRHYHISIFYSSQKFNLTDKLLRDVTQRVIWCKKIWRLMCQDVFNADDMEYASNPTLIKPIKRTGFFVLDKDYAAYDTLACVDNLKKKVDQGDMMTEQEILEMRGDLNPDNDNVTRRSLKLKRRQRHM